MASFTIHHWHFVLWPVRDGDLGDLMQKLTIRRSVIRGQPYGSAEWVDRTAQHLGLESTLRPLGRPKKSTS